jgi:hypothetical protein
VPQSRGNRLVLGLSVLCLVGGLGLLAWSNYTKTAGYQAKQQLSKAEQLAHEGKVGEAAQLYLKVAQEWPDHVKAALSGFKKLLGSALDSASLKDAAIVIDVAVNWPDGPYLSEGLGDRAMEMLKQRGEQDLDGALRLINRAVSAPLARDQAHLDKLAKEGDELLEGWVKKNPDHLEAAVNLGFSRLRRGNNAGVEEVLSRFRDTIKKTNAEGAHLLSAALANQGKNVEALTLLEPYCDERIPKYMKAAAAYRNAFQEMKRTVVPQIDDGSAPDFDFDHYRRGDPLTKSKVVSAYIEKRLAEKPETSTLRQEFRDLAPLQVAVINLGRLQLAVGQATLDPASRKAKLEKAKETAATLRKMAPDEMNSFLFSGSVAYAMGEPEEGKKFFEELLSKTGKATAIMLQVADTYSSVGEFTEARKVIEEAYNNKEEKDKGSRFELAFQRSRVPIDTEDEIAWLKKSDPDSDRTKLYLLESQSRLAEEQGRFIEAADSLRKVIEAVGKTGTDSPGRDNQLALLWLRLFRVTGEQSALTKGLELLDKALKKLPDQPVIVHNAALHLYQSASFGLAMESLDPSVLRIGEGLLLLEYLYHDRAGREEQAARVRKHPGMIKARELLKKLLTLQPRQSLAYNFLGQLYSWDHDVKAMEELEAQLRKVGVDEAEAVQTHVNFYSGKTDEQYKQSRKRFLDRWEKLAEEMRRKKKERSLAVALANLVHLSLDGERYGEPVDADQVVKLAEEAYAAHVCRMTTEQLKDALLYRAHRRLIARDQEYKKMAERSRRSLPPPFLVVLALTREGSARALALADADVVRAAKLVKERAEAFPDEPTPWIYAMLKATHSETAARVAEALRTDAIQRLKRSMSLKLRPLNLTDALGQYWVLQLEGKDKEGEALLRTLGERGVPLPFEVGK